MSSAIEIGSKYKTTAVGLVAKTNADYGEWEVALGVCCDLHRSSQWWIGDLLNIGEHTYGETYSQALDATGFDEGYLRNLKYVTSRIPLSLRSDKLTFSHHQLVAPLEPDLQEAWIGRAIENHWTVKQMREAMQGEGEDLGDDDGEGDGTSDEELDALIEELDDYISKLNGSRRSAAIKRVLRNLKALANEGKESAA